MFFSWTSQQNDPKSFNKVKLLYMDCVVDQSSGVRVKDFAMYDSPSPYNLAIRQAKIHDVKSRCDMASIQIQRHRVRICWA